ncbi:hypothetical protein Tco_1578706 [Tanacetum coccineum]
MPTEMELTLEQTQQGVSYEVSNIRVNSFTMKMEILLEPTSNKLMVEHAEFDESNTHVLERFYTSAGNPVKEILLKLNLPDHRKLKDGGKVKEFQRSFRHSDTERLSRSDEVLKLKNFKKDATLKLFKSTNQESFLQYHPSNQLALHSTELQLPLAYTITSFPCDKLHPLLVSLSDIPLIDAHIPCSYNTESQITVTHPLKSTKSLYPGKSPAMASEQSILKSCFLVTAFCEIVLSDKSLYILPKGLNAYIVNTDWIWDTECRAGSD